MPVSRPLSPGRSRPLVSYRRPNKCSRASSSPLVLSLPQCHRSRRPAIGCLPSPTLSTCCPQARQQRLQRFCNLSGKGSKPWPLSTGLYPVLRHQRRLPKRQQPPQPPPLLLNLTPRQVVLARQRHQRAQAPMPRPHPLKISWLNLCSNLTLLCRGGKVLPRNSTNLWPLPTSSQYAHRM